MYIIRESVLKVYIYSLIWRRKRRSRKIVFDLDVFKQKKFDEYLKVYFISDKRKALKIPDDLNLETKEFLAWINKHFTIKTVSFKVIKIK